MQLDVPTLMLMSSFVSACAAIILFSAWWQHRDISSVLLWAMGHGATALGILLVGAGSTTKLLPLLIIGGFSLSSGPGLMWMGARRFDSKRAPLLVGLAGMILVGAMNLVPGAYVYTPSVSLFLSGVYLLFAASSLWSDRMTQPGMRWPLVLVLVLHAAVLFGGAYDTLTGHVAVGQSPPVFSLFGMIYFEGTIFSIATAVFVLSLVKDRAERRALAAAKHDHLTGAANRGAFLESSERMMERCRRDKSPVATVMFDLDLFKRINDTHGHATGDQVLVIFAEIAAAALRPQDIFGRIGGEEFALLLPGCGMEAAYVRADRIRASFAEACRTVGGVELAATVSGGVCASEDAAEPLAALLENSDRALYRAKADGRNRVERAPQPRRKSGSSTVLRVA